MNDELQIIVMLIEKHENELVGEFYILKKERNK
jgi:hypothetical protein